MSVAFDPETASLEELRAKADAQDIDNTTQDPPQQDPVQDPVDDQDPPDEVVYRREIDLGDGSGVQVFEAPTIEELVDKLATAQEHATRKIRELTATKKTATEPTQQELDEEFILSQELANNPSLAFDKLFQKRLGSSPEEVKKGLQRLADIDREAADKQAAVTFVEKNPDYVATPKNGAKIDRYLKTYNLPGTVENIEKAFQDLSESGLLETKKPEGTQGTDTQQQTRIVAVTGHQRKVASGLSARRTAPVTRAAGPTQEELETMPLEKLRELSNKELAAQQ